MNLLLKVILSLSLSGSLLILALLLCRPLVKDRLSKRWQYYIWLVVVARLLVPFAPERNLMGTIFQHFDHTVIQADAGPHPVSEPSAFPETDFDAPYSLPSQAGSGGGEPSEPEQAVAPSVFELAEQNAAAVCLLVWLIVAVGLFIRKITVYQSFVKYMKAGQVEISDMDLWERVGKLAEQTGVKRAVGLYTNSLISSPLLIGFFRPCIMLPTARLSESDFENTILHELTHYQRRDMFYKWLVQVTICLHWFNPLVYIMGREVNRTCELSCDETVIKAMDEGGRRAYGDTLLNAMGVGGNYKDALASVTLNEGKELLKERLDAIMKFEKKSGLAVCSALLLTALLLCGFTLTGAYAAKQKGNAVPAAPAADDTAGEENTWAQIFEEYRPYGVVYHAEEDSAYYYGERIRLFVEFKPEETGNAFAFCYQDSKADSTLYLEAVRDGNGGIKEIRPLDEEIALDLIEDCVSAYPISHFNKTSSMGAVAMDATQTLENYGIVVTDKDLARDKVPQNIKDWIAQCDAKQGAYLLTSKLESGYLSYVYYNGGGRYPWNVSADNDTIHINFYRDSGLSTSDGYCLLSFTAPKEYKNIQLYLDHDPKQVVSTISPVKDESEDGNPNPNIRTVPVDIDTVKNGAFIWLGEFNLSYGDKMRYDVSAETGNGLEVGFAAPEDDPSNRTYFTVSNRRGDGALNVIGDFTFTAPVKPGQHSLFIRAVDGDLTNVEGSVTIEHTQSLSGTDPILPAVGHVNVNFDGISVIGKGPVGVELVKAQAPNVTFELLNMDVENACTANADIVDGMMQISVNCNAPKGITVDFGPEYKNVVRVYIPDAEYKQFDIQTTDMVVQMQDFDAPVHVESNRAGFWLIDDVISQGTYSIKVSSGPIYIEAATILSNITANAVSGPLTVRFHKAPANLYLDSTGCGPVVERPDDWPAIYKAGDETPRIILSNTGKAVIEVQSKDNDGIPAMETVQIGDKIYYQVENETQLRAIGQGDYGLDQNYIQAADIHMSTNEWVPIGTKDRPFSGSYCGNGREIVGLTMTDPDATIIGLFGVADGANIYNITMRDYDIQTAGRNVTGKSVAPILALALGGTRSYDNRAYPKDK